MKSFSTSCRIGLWLILFGGSLLLFSCDKQESPVGLMVTFDEKYGQIEVGGKFVGLEFHHSRPLPTRISFYYPVANSIDLSTDYWKRDESRPLSLLIKVGDRLDTLETQSLPYTYAPHTVEFEKKDSLYHLAISYHFCDDLPVVVWKINLKNTTHQLREYRLTTGLRMVLRSCHSYHWIEESRGEYRRSGSEYLSYFENSEVDSAVIFVTHPEEKPISERRNPVDSSERKNSTVSNFKKFSETRSKLESCSVDRIVPRSRSGHTDGALQLRMAKKCRQV